MNKTHIHKGCGGFLKLDNGALFCSRCGVIKTKQSYIIKEQAEDDGNDFLNLLIAEELIEIAVESAIESLSETAGELSESFSGFGGGESGGGGATESFESFDGSDSNNDSSSN